jgi:hypothetical protein
VNIIRRFDSWQGKGAFLGVLLAFSGQGCAKFVLSEREKKTEPKPEPTQRQVGIGTGVQPPPPPERIIRLTVAQVQPEAWWNTCLSLGINNEPEVEVGCGKSSVQLGKVIELPAKKNFCNVLKLRMKVTTGCPATHTCEVKSWERKTSVPGHLKYFKLVSGDKLLTDDGDIQPDATMKATLDQKKSEAKAHLATSGNSWTRVWFEDQTEENYALWLSDKTKWETNGVDFNDYVIDLKGEAVAFKIEGQTDNCPGLP